VLARSGSGTKRVNPWKSIYEERRLFSRCPSRHREQGVEVSSGLFLAVPDPWLVSFTGANLTSETLPKWRIEQQTYRGAQSPPSFAGYELVENRFGRGVKILGVPVSRTPGGWEYAVFRRVD